MFTYYCDFCCRKKIWRNSPYKKLFDIRIFLHLFTTFQKLDCLFMFFMEVTDVFVKLVWSKDVSVGIQGSWGLSNSNSMIFPVSLEFFHVCLLTTISTTIHWKCFPKSSMCWYLLICTRKTSKAHSNYILLTNILRMNDMLTWYRQQANQCKVSMDWMYHDILISDYDVVWDCLEW